jgi:hypothetical protein
MNDIEIIISRFNEDLNWTTEGIFNDYKYTVYNKGDNDNFNKSNVKNIINLPNIGRCDHTYLYHIVSNYNKLSNKIVFFPGSLDLGYKKNIAIEILNKIKYSGQAIFIGEYSENIKNKFDDFKLDNWSSTNSQNFIKNNESSLQISKIRPFGNWFKYYFGNKIVKSFCYWGVFSIDKRDVVQHPINRYIILLNQLNQSSNPEVGHYLERSWCAVFHPMKFTKILLRPYI